MKNFIEVVTDCNNLIMININTISLIWKNSTHTFIAYNSGKQEIIRTNASYEEIKRKIEEAQI